MTIEYYILEQANRMQMLRFMCQLVETFYQAQKSIYIHTESLNAAEQVDKLLWTYRDDSFLPHQLTTTSDVPIEIGYQEAYAKKRDCLINLHTQIPPFYKQFNHIVEIVFPDPTIQSLARERYKQYRNFGLEINTKKINHHDFN